MKKFNSSIHKIGLSKCNTNNLQYFSQILVSNKSYLSDKLPDINQILSILIEPEIIHTSISNTIQSISNEGQYLSGKKLIITMKLKQKILYSSNDEFQSVHVIETDFLNNGFIVIPNKINGTDPTYLLNLEMLKVKVHIEDIILHSLDCRTILKDIYIFLEAIIIPTFQLCYILHDNNNYSNIFMCFDDGSRCLKKTFNNYKKIKPLWSPAGKQIAFLCINETGYMLYTLDTKGSTPKQLTSNLTFDCINSFSWLNDNKIVFCATINNCSDIFCIDIVNLETRQLTHTKSPVSSFNPKCSSDGKSIAFLTSNSTFNKLCIINSLGLDFKEIPSTGSIKNFAWSSCGNYIAYVNNGTSNYDELSLLNLNSLKQNKIIENSIFHSIRNINYSSTNKFVCFIGVTCDKEDIYLYDLNKNKLINLTRNFENIKIKDLVLHTNEDRIYYSSNALGYFNIYVLFLDTLNKIQITNETASNIELSYRSRIV